MKIINFFLPKICVLCSKEGCNICKACISLMEKGGSEDFEQFKAFYCFKYNQYSAQIIKDLKYNQATENAKLIAEKIFEMQKDEILKSDIIIPVGTSFIKRIFRKYNSPNLIALHLNKLSKVQVLHEFFGKRFFGIKKSQVGLSKLERIENLKKAFYVKKPISLKGKTVILLDDVITTGSTVRTCVNEVLKFEPKEVKVVSFLRRDLMKKAGI